MNKYSLSFVDPKIEAQYIEQNWNTATRNSFSFLSCGVVFAYGLRVIMAHVNQDFSLYYLKLAAVIYALLQLAVVKRKPKLGRIGFLLLNILVVTFDYFESVTLNVDNDISSLRGTNLMAASFLFMQTGEFFDAIFSLSVLIIYQISKYFIFGTTLNISVLMTTLILRMYLFYYLYQFHKAKKAEYLLRVVETCWDKIFLSLIHKPFILIKFNYQNFVFSIENSNKLPFIIADDGLNPFDDRSRKFSDAYYFLRHATIGKQAIQTYIFEKIKKFQSDLLDSFNESVYAKFQNKQIILKYSIFQAKDPLILIQIEPYKCIQKRLKINDLFTKYTGSIVQLLDQLTLKFRSYQPIKILKRKLIIIQCLEQMLQNQISIQSIDIYSILVQIRQLFPDYLVIITVQNDGQTIETFPNILLLFLIVVLNCSRNKKLIFNAKNNNEESTFEIRSSYNIVKFHRFYKKFQGNINLILTDILINEKCICFNLFKEPIQPFIQRQ